MLLNVFKGRINMTSADFLLGLPREGSPQVRCALLPCTTAAFTSTGKPSDFAVLCQLIAPCRPRIRFLFIGLQVSSSLPPHGRLPFRSWLQVVVFFMFSCLVFPTGDLHPIYNAPMMGAHKTQHRDPWNAMSFREDFCCAFIIGRAGVL